MNSKFLRVKNPRVVYLGDSGSDSLKGCSQDGGWSCHHLETRWGLRISLQVHARGSWQADAAPHCVAVSVGLLTPAHAQWPAPARARVPGRL